MFVCVCVCVCVHYTHQTGLPETNTLAYWASYKENKSFKTAAGSFPPNCVQPSAPGRSLRPLWSGPFITGTRGSHRKMLQTGQT